MGLMEAELSIACVFLKLLINCLCCSNLVSASGVGCLFLRASIC